MDTKKTGALNFEDTSFFVKSSYLDAWNREKPCYLISRRGADVIANKLTGEKGVLFTAAYVTKFHEMSKREHEREIETLKKQAVTPRLSVFNKAIRTVMGGLNFADASANIVMKFLQDTYRPFGIEVEDVGEQSRFYSAGIIARALGVYSLYGNPHAHAITAIIDKLDMNLGGHIEVAPYGLVGFSVRYDITVAEAIEDWLVAHGKPHNIPHNGFEYHIFYENPLSVSDAANSNDTAKLGVDDDVDGYEPTVEELDEMCGEYSYCDDCPYFNSCGNSFSTD